MANGRMAAHSPGGVKKKTEKTGRIRTQSGHIELEQTIQKSPSRLSGNGSAAIALKNGTCNVAEKAYEYAIMECKHSCFSSMASFSGLDKIYDQPRQKERDAKIKDDGFNGASCFSIALP